MIRVLWCIPLVWFALHGSGIADVSVHAQGAADIERKVTIVGFDEAKELYLVKIKAGTFDTVFMVRDVDTQKRVAHMKAGTKKEERAALKRLKRRHKILDEGVEGQVSPDERYTIIGVPSKDGKAYRVLAMDGGRLGQLARIDLRSVVEDEEPKFATGMIKQVMWSSDGKLVMVVLTEKLVSDTVSEENDREIPIWFRRWKIKWLPPPELPKPADP
jgi:hypothetical protein